MRTKEILEHLASMPFEERASIVDSLLRTLNQPDAEIDRLWAAEAQRRLDELRSGQTEAIPADVVFAKARERFTK